jgi:hypothetical protein
MASGAACERRSLRCGPRTLRLGEIPAAARLIRSAPKHRYCWAVGPPLKRLFRRRALRQRMAQYQFEPIYQPRLLARLQSIWPGLAAREAQPELRLTAG